MDSIIPILNFNLLNSLQFLHDNLFIDSQGDGHTIFPYLLRNLEVVRSNQVWAMDISYYGKQKIMESKAINADY